MQSLNNLSHNKTQNHLTKSQNNKRFNKLQVTRFEILKQAQNKNTQGLTNTTSAKQRHNIDKTKAMLATGDRTLLSYPLETLLWI